MDPGSGDYHLSPGSPCIDAGTNAAPSLPDSDFEGDPRVIDGDYDGIAIVDMGVDEAWKVPVYVDRDATGDNNGASWEDAFTSLQLALEDAADGDEIWVAAGTYTPTYEYSPGDPRSATFQLKNGIVLYGGFDPSTGDAGWQDRDWVNNATILSGDIGTQGDPEDNSYHVFYHPSELVLDGTAVLDGFTVTGGNANGYSDLDKLGGGMFNDSSSPVVVNCTFSGNSASWDGGGMSNSHSSPTVIHSAFSGNSAGAVGGGMYNHYSSPAVTHCTFFGNEAESVGGGMYNGASSSPAVTNCTFSGNSAVHHGGGMYNEDSSPAVTNCTFSGNLAGSYGGGMANRGSSPTVTDCTFLGNSVSYGGGGGMYNELSSSPTVANCTFSGNSAGPYGGGMYNSSRRRRR